MATTLGLIPEIMIQGDALTALQGREVDLQLKNRRCVCIIRIYMFCTGCIVILNVLRDRDFIGGDIVVKVVQGH